MPSVFKTKSSTNQIFCPRRADFHRATAFQGMVQIMAKISGNIKFFSIFSCPVKYPEYSGSAKGGISLGLILIIHFTSSIIA